MAKGTRGRRIPSWEAQGSHPQAQGTEALAQFRNPLPPSQTRMATAVGTRENVYGKWREVVESDTSHDKADEQMQVAARGSPLSGPSR